MSSNIAERLVARLEPLLDQDRIKFHGNIPSPHIVIDQFLNKEVARQVECEFPPSEDTRWNRFSHVNDKKLAYNTEFDLPPAVKRLVDALSSNTFVRYMEKLTKVEGLIPDHFSSGAMHYTLAGGYIKLHLDPTVHPVDPRLKRQFNLLIYLNKNWEESFGGELQLWDIPVTKCFKKVLPAFNRAIIIDTKTTVHGFPEPIRCSEDNGRKALVMYYFTREKMPIPAKITNYKAQPDDSFFVKMKVFYGRTLLQTFYFLKRYFNFNEKRVFRVMKFAESILTSIGLKKR